MHASDPEKHASTTRVEHVGVREGYDLWAESYDASPNPLVALDARVTIAALDGRARERVLDAGCGTGRNAERLLAAGARVVGVDASRGMLAIARRRCPRATFVLADLHARLPFADASFDAVLCALVGEHLADLATPLAELRRVARPGGRIVFSVWHPAMAAAGKTANFERAGVEYRLGAELHTLPGYLEAFERAGWPRPIVEEHAVDAELVAKLPAAARDLGKPYLLLLRARR